MDTSVNSGNYFSSKDHLDLSILLDILSRYFHFTQSQHLIKESPKRLSHEEIALLYFHQDQVQSVESWDTEIKDHLNLIHPDLSFSKVRSKLSRFQVLDTKEIYQIFKCINQYGKLAKAFSLKGHTHFSKQEIDSTFKFVRKNIPQLFDDKTEDIIYYKHPILSPIHFKIKECSKQIREKLIKITSDWSKRELLQTQSHDIVDDRYLLPVRSDRYTSQLGKIVYRSNTGNTLFVEPNALREVANIKIELEAQLEREAHKLIKAISDMYADQFKVLDKMFSFFEDLDLASGRLAASTALGFCKPDIDKYAKKFYIKELFHPLISNPVKNDFNLLKKDSGLLISGPNTGGKTVLLKSLSLCLLLPHLGFHIPAQSAIIPYCESLHFLSHDNQDLQEGLSSFSSEAIVYLNLFKNIKKGDSVFIDEIFNSTSSLEASELALAIIKELKERGVFVFISSHHENLKQWVFQESLLESAHMGFKDSNSTPTYILHQGSPGKSYAKEVFKNLERHVLGSKLISQHIVTSRSSFDDIETKIAELEEIENEKRLGQETIKETQDRLLKEKESIKGLLEIEKQKLQEAFDKKWQQLKKKTLDEAEKSKKGSSRSINKLATKLSELNPQKENQKLGIIKDQGPVENPEVGMTVFIKALSKEGQIIAVSGNGKKVQLNCKGLKVWQPVSQIRKVNQSSYKRSQQVRVSVSKSEDTNRSMSLDARGMRRDEFLQQAELHILDVINGDLPFVDIIHGHGDGILKSSLYKLLQRFRDDVHFDFVEGNQGTTRVELIH
ncbi:MAG: hypothetical protein CME60_08960 [Halobacteriovoraceae bacterium]|nr:hypothetical protein [Halobacteriovoraceae bacterium]